MPTEVLLWDQREIIRAGIKSICLLRDDLKIVGDTGDEETAIALARNLCPDVVIVDMALIQKSAQQAFERLVGSNPQRPPKFLVLAEENRPDVSSRITEAGASGYLTLQHTFEEIAFAVRCIAKGRIFISHSHGVVPQPKSPFCETSHLSKATFSERQVDLTHREREVLSLISQGMTNKQAAATLALSIKTVETYRSRIMKKHGLKDRLELIKFAATVETTNDERLELS